ncbi:CtsR family transcriptional regulator [Peptostreptococcaceae bacterium AGR-M142]
MSDLIEKFIKELLDESNSVQIKRNELADYFECAPSQINYVLTTRFNSDRGYYIESRRGGGGYIKIIKINLNEDDYLSYLIKEEIGSSLSYKKARLIISNLKERDVINQKEQKIILSAINDRVLNIPVDELRDRLRANILKSIIINLF